MVICVSDACNIYRPVSFALREARRDDDYAEFLSEADPMPGIIDVADVADPAIDALRQETQAWR